MTCETVRLKSVHARYALSGPGSAPVVMFCNSLMADMRLWDRVAAQLGNWRLLRYDMRGHGGTAALPGDYSIADLAGDAMELLDYLQLSNVHLVGISLGGMVALQMAAQAPDRIASLTIGNTGTRLAPEDRAAWDARRVQALERGLEAIAGATLSRWFTPGFLEQQPELVEEVRSMLVSVDPLGYAGCAAAIRDLDIDGLPERVQLRTLFLHGRHDGAWPEAGATALARRLGAQLEFIEDAGHVPCIEQPAAYASALGNFLQEASPAHQHSQCP